MKALFYVQHLLGTGHVRRAALIGRALSEAGINVTIAQGGFPVAGVDFAPATLAQLPPARAADASFRPILDAAGRPIDAGWKARRAAALLGLFGATEPDILIIETYPFGRKPFRFELEPLLDQAARRRPRPLIVCSLRDILVGKDDAAREQRMAETAARLFDLVLVHGDPAILPLDATFPFADRIRHLIRYTGYVAHQPVRFDQATDDEGRAEVIVSVGGGAVGEALLRTAIDARKRSRLAAAPWRLLIGPDQPDALLGELRAAAPAGITIERARPDFPALLARCRLSISQAGYNTVMDVLTAGCRSVLVPFGSGAEAEQRVRAALLAERGLAVMVPEQALSPTSLAEAVDRALAMPLPARPALALDGAAETARLILAAARGGSKAAGAGVT